MSTNIIINLPLTAFKIIQVLFRKRKLRFLSARSCRLLMRLFELLVQNVHTREQYWKRGSINAFTDVLGLKNYRSSPPKVFLEKGVLKICSKFTYTGEHPCRSLISINLLIKITHRQCCSPVNLLHIFRKPFPKNTSCRLALF